MTMPVAANSPQELATPLIGSEIQQVEVRLLDLCDQSQSDLCRAARDAIMAGGKRGRPIITLLSAAAFGEITSITLDLAVAVEIIHVASLMHDDVLDEATVRRGKPSVRQLWGNRRAVLVGDFLVARAYQTLASLREGEYSQLLTSTVMEMCTSEALFSVIELDEMSLENYLNLARGKTSLLFAAAAAAGARSAEASDDQCKLMKQYGEALGIAFQATDDLLDLYGDPAKLGKTTGRDIITGQVNLPIVLALQHPAAARLREVFVRARKLDNPVDALPEVQVVVEELGGRVEAEKLAQDYVKQAVNALQEAQAPNTAAVNVLMKIVQGLLVRYS